MSAIALIDNWHSVLNLVCYTLVALGGQPPLPWTLFAPFKALLDRCWAVHKTRAYSHVPKAEMENLATAMGSLMSILIHSGHSRGRDPPASSEMSFLLSGCKAPWIACQNLIKESKHTPCEPTAVLNKVTLAFSGLSMCANVSALAAFPHVSSG